MRTIGKSISKKTLVTYTSANSGGCPSIDVKKCLTCSLCALAKKSRAKEMASSKVGNRNTALKVTDCAVRSRLSCEGRVNQPRAYKGGSHVPRSASVQCPSKSTGDEGMGREESQDETIPSSGTCFAGVLSGLHIICFMTGASGNVLK